MTNFDFLQNNTEFQAFSTACIEAEKSIAVSPALCALGIRKSAELAVKWLYSVDKLLTLPAKDNLSALIFNPSFMDSVDEDMMGKLKYIVKLGNFAAHTDKNITRREATLSLGCLFDVVLFIDYCYGSAYEDRIFDETLLPTENAAAVSKTELEQLKSQLDAKDDERQKLLDDLKQMQSEMERLRAENASSRVYTAGTNSEADTRKSYIDVDLKAMGWQFRVDCFEEVPVFGMPTESGSGFVDYVLNGDNGKPLAVVEAKKTTVDPKVGRHQAKLYADCLEAQYGQRPFIFYTNGYDTWFWDDTSYPERKVYSVFSKEDLQRLMTRREQKIPFDNITINPEITDRHYQKTAIQRICGEFSQSRRKALLVMATGTGKTRTAVSLVDVLASHAWVTNVLFLADRIELVKQAKDAFTKHMPNLSSCNLLKRGNDKPTDRMIFSTYPTIMNAINEETTEDGKKLFTPSHFDLIIIDEAHRSIFKKYRAIFNYFDALLVGLTATPKDEVDRNTYDFFGLENNMPTYAYEYNTAVSEGFLTDYHCMEKMFKIPTEGIHYDEMTSEQQALFEDAFEEDEEVPDFISGESINSQYFNVSTNQSVIQELMLKGLKVEGGDKLGKTIIFAKSHAHAEFIKKQFDELYPQYCGDFAAVIDSKVKHAEDLLTAFKQKDKYPQIAISVDMLDTGIDVPEILNLVFFKRVMSKTKFWQMFGRGTRLCEDIFGPGEDKKQFYIFDFLGNFEFFRQDPKGVESDSAISMAEYTFKLKVTLIRELQDMKFQESELIEYRKVLVTDITSSVAGLNRTQFQVKQNLEMVERYSNAEAFQYISLLESENIITHLAGLVPALDDDESARRLDALMYKMAVAHVTGDENGKRAIINRVKNIARSLEPKATIPQVLERRETIQKVQQDSFWASVTVLDIEEIRQQLRDLMQYLKKEMRSKIINVTDSVLFEKEGERFAEDPAMEGYYQRAERYVRENEAKPSIQKLKNNEPLRDEDWNELEKIFWHDVGTEKEYEAASNGVSLGRFVRGITGLSREAALSAFSEFLNSQLFTEAQIAFVHCIIEWLARWGTVTPEDMKDDEFAGGEDILEIFNDNIEAFQQIKRVIDSINNNALRMAA
jgi:Type I site-specific restriction-modification system, R (restriction) subunit and related helicases